MAQFVQKGENIDFKNAGTAIVNYGDVVVLGKRIGVANCNIDVGGVGTVAMTGVYDMPAESTSAFVVGDELYWDVANKKLTKTATGGVLAGLCIDAKATATATARVRM